MRKGLSKGLKPKIIKHLALLMSCCYLLGPVQHHVTTILHEIAHGLEMPSSVLSHNSAGYDEEVHQAHKHEIVTVDHDHELIDLVDTIFEASNERGPHLDFPKFSSSKYLPNSNEKESSQELETEPAILVLQ